MKPTITVTTEFGTFKRQTSRKYTHFVITTGGDIRWSTRLNLAMKYADELRGRGYENVKIIEIATGKAV